MNPLRRFLHWGPFASIAIAGTISVSTMSCISMNLLWTFIFHLSVCLTLYNMWCALLIGPGYVTGGVDQQGQPQQAPVASNTIQAAIDDSSDPSNSAAASGDVVDNNNSKGKFCRRCCHIVLRKHHHCPWINNCVGLYNDSYFTKFLMFAIVTTLQSTSHLTIEAYALRPLLSLHLNKFLFDIFSLGLSVGVLVCAVILLYLH